MQIPSYVKQKYMHAKPSKPRYRLKIIAGLKSGASLYEPIGAHAGAPEKKPEQVDGSGREGHLFNRPTTIFKGCEIFCQ